ncbi:autotransporter domain-containing protein [Roseiconus nitratireducens]|uniref:Autotransporter domain-containing protein n=1 Tax=Roseiconus nitratireducens TaxID=2605748 RepID=A0A5M6CVW2_9BACT|nr:autotransporter domain-containing protein [Roseiconus nitratireducens]KAA5539203.1 autotransporter domain-containing protein [Roseiconus nitratireducens]
MSHPRLLRVFLLGLIGTCAGSLSAQTYSSTDTPIGIPPSGTRGTTISSINVPDSIMIDDLDVNVDYNHTFQGDLSGTVTSPGGTNVSLFSRVGSGLNAQNGGYRFDDDSANTFPGTLAPGTYQPNQPLSAFNGENAQGVWTLTIDDQVGGDSGTLNLWQLLFTAAGNDTSEADILASGAMIELQATSHFLGLLSDRLRGGVGMAARRFAPRSTAASASSSAGQIRLVSTAPSSSGGHCQSAACRTTATRYVFVNPLRRDARKTRAWVTGYGAKGNLDQDFRFDFSGVAFGAERQVDCSTIIGLAGNYYDSDGSMGTAGVELDALGIALYGSRQIRTNGYLTGIIGYSSGDYSTLRPAMTGSAVGKTDSDTFLSLFELGKNVRHGNLIIQPHAAFQYIGISADGYSETGGGLSNLQIADDHVNSARGILGLNFFGTIPTYCSGTLSPFYRIAYAHEFADDNQVISGGFAGGAGPLVFQGPELGRDFLNSGVGISYVTPSGLTLFADYDAQYSSEYEQHTGQGGLSFAW